VVEHLGRVEQRLSDGERPVRVAGQEDPVGELEGWAQVDGT
jgi:hypothetical protein